MAYELTEPGARLLVAIETGGGSAVVSSTGTYAKLLSRGEYINTVADLSLRLVAYGYLTSNNEGRLSLTNRGQAAALVFQSTGKIPRKTYA